MFLSLVGHDAIAGVTWMIEGKILSENKIFVGTKERKSKKRIKYVSAHGIVLFPKNYIWTPFYSWEGKHARRNLETTALERP